MHRFLSLFLDVAVSALILGPALWLLKGRLGWSRRRALSYFALALYLSLVFSLVGLPDIRYIRFEPNINLRPFRYFFSDWSTLPNVLLFVPLGVFLTTLWGRFRSGWRACLFGFWVSMTIEVLQIFTFRATDVNDLITNTLGTALGWALGRFLLAIVPGFTPSRNTREVYGLCFGTFAFMVLLHPLLADPIFSLVFL